MKKRIKEILSYSVLGLLGFSAAALSVFAVVRRAHFTAAGDSVMAEFCVKMGIVCFAVAILSLIAIRAVWKKNRRREALAGTCTWDAPLFETWYVKETNSIKERYGKAKVIAGIFIVMISIMVLFCLVMILDGVDGILCFNVILGAGGIVILYRMADYKRNYIQPLDNWIRKELPFASDKEAFARQICRKERKELEFMSASMWSLGNVWVMPDYCYIRQFGKSRIIKNVDLSRAVLKRVIYSVGLKSHFRRSFVMDIYTKSSGQKPAWSAFFADSGKLYKAVSLMRTAGLPESGIEDMIAYAGTEEGRKKACRSNLVSAVQILGILILLFLLIKSLQDMGG